MKKLSIHLLLSLMLIFVFNTEVKSSWFLGGDLSYTNIGQDSFIIKLVMYRDCNSINPWNANITIKCKSTNQTITTVTIPKPTGIDITPVCSNSCTRCQSGSCSFPYGVEKYEYQKLVVLNTTCCELILSYQMCCRIVSITTGSANKIFYIESTLNRCITPQNSSPIFKADPLLLLCKGQSYQLNIGAYKTDGDSLTYEFAYPQKAHNSDISYIGQYDYNKPIYFWDFPNNNLPFPKGMHLDPINGDISFKPMKSEQTVMVIKVSEFRNGVKIGEIRRDVILHILNCPTNSNPKLLANAYKSIHIGDSINYIIGSSDPDANDTLLISYDNSIPSATWTNNNGVKHPYGTLKWIPDSSYQRKSPYIFTVSAKDDVCPLFGATSRAYKIYITPEPSAIYNITDLGCGKYKFSANTFQDYDLDVIWNNEKKILSNQKTFNYKFSKPGIYPIQLQVYNPFQDTTTYFDTITTNPFLWAYLPKDTNICHGDSMTISAQIFNNQGYTSINWNTNDTTQTIQTAQLFQDKTYTVTVQDQSGCSFTAQTKVTVNTINVDLGQDIGFCIYDSISLDVNYILNGGNFSSVEWTKYGNTSFHKNTNNIFVHDSGTYICKITDDIGCF
ncbi:MAG: hypothetical protein U9R42_12105, partial [Bacteroidota bacterium]|nr:hypothetical protein [Bacteroidota bacterium]